MTAPGEPRVIRPSSRNRTVLMVCASCSTEGMGRTGQRYCSRACVIAATRGPRMSMASYIETNSMPEPNSGCWLWLGNLSDDGYAIARREDARSKFVHRASYELHCEPIPDGLVIDHLCRVRCCVNPGHLEPVTLVENIARGQVGECTRQRQLSAKQCKRGHAYEGDNFRIRKNGSRICMVCKRMMDRAWYRTSQRASAHAP